MAKARDVPVGPDTPFAEAARRTIAVRAQEMLELREGVLDTADLERVHAMRVAARRLRAALEIFATCFKGSQVKPLLRDVGALAEALGARRDPDMQLAALEAFGAAMPEADREGVALLAARLREAQGAANAALAAALAQLDEGELSGRLAALAGLAAEAPALADPPPAVEAAAPEDVVRPDPALPAADPQTPEHVVLGETRG
jgi:CHAD domain-containing protein